MAKQTTSAKQPVLKELKNTFHFFPFANQTAPFIVIILLGLIFNLTSLHNEYALDDGIIIHQNKVCRPSSNQNNSSDCRLLSNLNTPSDCRLLSNQTTTSDFRPWRHFDIQNEGTPDFIDWVPVS